MSDRPTDWHVKPPSKVRSVQDALASAERRRNDLPHVVQVYAADWDEVILADHIATLKSEVAALRAEVEGMREDAERYRWLRDTANYDDIMATLLSRAPHHKIDAAINAARKGTK